MQVFDALPCAPLPGDFAVTVGTFDGVHRGHQELVGELRRAARARGLGAAVLTFADMPYCYFRPDDCPRLLSLPDEKIAACARLDIDRLLIVPFDRRIAEQSAEEFVGEVLVARLGMKLLVAGPDFALGRGRGGTIDTLGRLGRHFAYEVQVLDGKLEETGAAISSTRTREAVESGDAAGAARLLGHPFSMHGEVVSGRQLGRTIGVPTINLRLHPRKVVPRHGIYAARAYFDDDPTAHRAALSIGANPTVDGEGLNIEFHVIDEDVPVPPRTARIEVVAWLRAEAKFPSIEALVAQMKGDIEQARNMLR